MQTWRQPESRRAHATLEHSDARQRRQRRANARRRRSSAQTQRRVDARRTSEQETRSRCPRATCATSASSRGRASWRRATTGRGTNAALLRLPPGCLLHPVFNLDLLKKFIDGAREFPGRPVRYDRQGPVPEEDPAAGGPQAGEPVYAEEAVIARRGTGTRRQYRVRWKGWPP